MSNQQIVVAIQQTLVDGFSSFSNNLFYKCGNLFGMDGDAAGDALPLVFGDPVYGEKNPDFVDFMVPGTIILIIFFLAIGNQEIKA